MKTVIALELSQYELPTNLVDYTAVIARTIDSVPKEYRDSMQIYFKVKASSVDLIVEYKRPETRMEIARKAEIKDMRDAYAKECDLKTLATLKAKYE